MTAVEIERKKEKIALYMHLVEEGKWGYVLDGMKTREELHQSVVQLLNI